MLLTTGLQKHVKKSSAKGLEILAKVIDGKYYRKDLLALAQAQDKKVMTSFKKKKVIVKSCRQKA